MTTPTLAEKIRLARQSAQLTQAQLAERLGLTRGAVTQWESKDASTRTTPSVDVLRHMADIVGVPIEWLLDEKARPDDVHFARARHVAAKRTGKTSYHVDNRPAARQTDEPSSDDATGEFPVPRRALAFWRAVEFELCSRRPDLEAAFEVPLSADDFYVVTDLQAGDVVVSFSVAPAEHGTLAWVRRKAGDLLVAEKLAGRALRKVLLVWCTNAPQGASLASHFKPLGIEFAAFATPREAAQYLLSVL